MKYPWRIVALVSIASAPCWGRQAESSTSSLRARRLDRSSAETAVTIKQRIERYRRMRGLWILSDSEVQKLIFQRHDAPFDWNLTFPPNANETTVPPSASPGTSPPSSTTNAPTSSPNGPGDTTAPTSAPVGGGTAPPDGGATTSPTTAPVGGATSAPTPPLGSIAEFLAQTLTDDGSLETPGTPQNQALNTLEQNFPDLVLPANADEITQIYALNTLFYASNGTNWRQREAWTGPSTVCGEMGVADQWFGVECDTDDMVTEIMLVSNDLFGTIPSEIRGLQALRKY